MNELTALLTALGTLAAAWIMLKSLWDYIDGDGVGHLVVAVISGVLFIYTLTVTVQLI